MKRKTREQLEKELSDLNEAYDELEKSIYRTQEKVTEILNGGRKLSYDQTRVLLADIPMRFAELKGRSTGEGEIMNGFNHHIENENSKLWYLVRVALKDETMTPVPYEDHMTRKLSPFDKPDFK